MALAFCLSVCLFWWFYYSLPTHHRSYTAQRYIQTAWTTQRIRDPWNTCWYKCEQLVLLLPFYEVSPETFQSVSWKWLLSSSRFVSTRAFLNFKATDNGKNQWTPQTTRCMASFAHYYLRYLCNKLLERQMATTTGLLIIVPLLASDLQKQNYKLTIRTKYEQRAFVNRDWPLFNSNHQ